MLTQSLALRAAAPLSNSATHSRRANMTQQRRLVAVRAADEQQQPEAAAAAGAASQEAPKDVCATCGVPLSQKAFGCDGTGRIAGGIGAVPGFGWWPIKAYRPCPKLAEAGMSYQRKGQITDEVLFGRGRQQ